MLLERNELTRQVQGSPNIRSVYLLAPADLHQAGGEGLVLCCLALRAPHLGCQQLNVENVPHASTGSTGFIGKSQKQNQAFSSSQKKGPRLGNSEKGKKKKRKEKKMAGVAEEDPEVPSSTIHAFPVRAGPAREGGEWTYQYWPFSTSDLYN